MYETFVVEQNQKWVIVVGDAKTYDIVRSICSEYEEQMKWVIPWPGDWHILLNYQKAIMKAYADAGLVTLGEATQHRSETLTSIIQCTNFRRTHNFLIQATEAFYRFFLSLYLRDREATRTPSELTDQIQLLATEFTSVYNDDDLVAFRDKVSTLKSSISLEDFKSYSDSLCQKQDTLRFWYQFATVDIMAYIGLYLGIRYRNWHLRNCSIKQLAAIFTAFDRPIYQQLIPHHIMDVLSLPDCVLHHLQEGGFSVNLTTTQWHGVGIDECHEMKINKDAKMAVVRPSATKMEYLLHYLPFQASCVNNFHQQLFPERTKSTKAFSHHPTSEDRKTAVNVEHILEVIANHGLFHREDQNAGLCNVFIGRKATSEQAHDMLNFRPIGQAGYEAFVESKLLHVPSTAAPVGRKRLCTFSSSPAQKRKVKEADKEAKISQRYLRKAVAWLAEHGPEEKDLETLLGPPALLPKALMDNDGYPYKGTKSSTTMFLERRYTVPPIISNNLPQG